MLGLRKNASLGDMRCIGSLRVPEEKSSLRRIPARTTRGEFFAFSHKVNRRGRVPLLSGRAGFVRASAATTRTPEDAAGGPQTARRNKEEDDPTRRIHEDLSRIRRKARQERARSRRPPMRPRTASERRPPPTCRPIRGGSSRSMRRRACREGRRQAEPRPRAV